MKDENYLGNYYGDKFHDGYDGAVYKPNGITPTLRARNSGGVFIVTKLDISTKAQANIKVTQYMQQMV